MSAPWQDVPVPERMTRLPVDELGRPVPWYAAWIGGRPDYRIIGPDKVRTALQFEACWFCGQPLWTFLAFLVGPMVGVTRNSPEPPSHVSCAEYAARVYPFLSLPPTHRRETSAPNVGLIWVTRAFHVWFPKPSDGPVIQVGDPVDTFWFVQGRRAYRAEVLDAVAAGLPQLRQVAMEQDDVPGARGGHAVAALDRNVRALRALIPSDSAPMGGA